MTDRERAFLLIVTVIYTPSQSLRGDRKAATVLPDEGVVKGGDEDPVRIVCHKLLSIFNALI